jgi:HlyD family secretion protein
LLIVSLLGAAAAAVAATPDLRSWIDTQYANAASEAGVQSEPRYITAKADITRIRRTITASGTLYARATVDVSSQLSGQISSVDANFNDSVSKGQQLAQLDQREFNARVKQAEAEVVIGKENIKILAARLEKAAQTENEMAARRKVFQARIEGARATLEATGKQQARATLLEKEKVIQAKVAEEARSAYANAKARLLEIEAETAAHEFAAASAAAGRQEADAEQAHAHAVIALRQAELDQALLQRDRSTIRSPIDGVVVGRSVEPGQTVAVSLNAPVLFTIVGDLTKMEIHASIDETDIGEIKAGQTARFTVASYPDHVFAAQVSEIRKAAQILQGVVTYTVVLTTTNKDGRLLPGMTSTLRIVTDETGPTLTVPLAALRYQPEGSFGAKDASTIWVLQPNGKIAPRALTLGADDQERISVLEGTLSEGDRVITGRLSEPSERSFLGIKF